MSPKKNKELNIEIEMDHQEKSLGKKAEEEIEVDFTDDQTYSEDPVPQQLEDFDDEKNSTEKAEVNRQKKKVVRKPTGSTGISARYIDGVLHSYDAEIFVGTETVFDERIKEFVRKKRKKKKSFSTFKEAELWRDTEKGKLAEKKKLDKPTLVKKWKLNEVIDLCRKYKEDYEKKGEAYLLDYDRYSKRAKKYFCEEIGKAEVTKIQAGDIEAYLLHEKTQYGYATQTLKKERSFLKGIWDFMAREPDTYNYTFNVVSEAKLPAGESEYKVRLLSYQQIEELIKEACELEDPFFLYLVVFSITQAMRRGELCGLQWGDIDWEKRGILIKRSKVQISGRNTLKKPKQNRIRYIEMHNLGYDTLKIYKQWQEEYLGRKVKNNEFVIKTPVNLEYGYDPHTGKISRKWKEIYTKINAKRKKEGKEEIPYGRIHDGRHVYASLLLKGVKKENGDELPHASYIQVYESMGHALPKALQNVTTQIYTE